METVRLMKEIDSDTLYLPELRKFIGKRVEITIEAKDGNATQASSPRERLWRNSHRIAGSLYLDPEVVERLQSIQ